MLSGIFSLLVTALGAVIGGFLAKSNTYRNDVDSDRSLEDLKAEYEKWESGCEWAFMLVLLPSMFLCWLALNGLARVHQLFLSEGEFVITATPSSWFFLAFALGLITAAYAVSVLSRQLLGPERFAEFQTYGRLQSEFNAEKFLSHIVWVTLTVIAVLTTLTLDTYVIASKEQLKVNGFFSLFTHDYLWDEITDILIEQTVFEPEDEPVRVVSHIVIDLNDGTTLSLDHVLFELSIEEQEAFAAFASERSGIPIIDGNQTSDGP